MLMAIDEENAAVESARDIFEQIKASQEGKYWPCVSEWLEKYPRWQTMPVADVHISVGSEAIDDCLSKLDNL
jgi:hypothetical protein